MIFLKGDWPYYFPEYLSSFSLPEIWSSVWPTGLGGNQAIILPLKLYLQGVVFLFVNKLGLPWEIIQIIFFFGLFIALSIYSSYKFSKSWIGSLIYTTNTWILLVFFGGQMGIGLAYAIAPLVLVHMMKLVHSSRFTVHGSVLAAVIFAMQVMFDIRVAFLTMLVFLGYTIFHYFFISRLNIKLLTINYSLLTITTLMLHSFWILPSIFVAIKGGNVASVVDTSAGSLDFFSFAKFENSISLLHPNWPENIFGKVAFMRPEFLLIPIVAFASLLFLNSKIKTQKSKLKNQNLTNITIKQYSNIIPFFALVGIIGAFLAKGTQEPFGIVFNFLYFNVPGFNLFRDPVKFYILIAISYSVLIPYTLDQVPKLKKIIPIAFVLFWAYLSLPFIMGSNSGIFRSRTVPEEYVQLKNFLISDSMFARTLWVPQVSRFGFVSDTHPALSFQDLFKAKKLEETVLSDMSVKYVIVPYDSEGEIFLTDRKYDERKYLNVVKKLDQTLWLNKLDGFGKIAVYEISNPKPHTWSKGDKLIFSESFDSNWYAESSGRRVYSKPYGRLNSFDLSPSEHDSAILGYEPQEWVTIGYLISGLTMLFALGVTGISLKRK